MIRLVQWVALAVLLGGCASTANSPITLLSQSADVKRADIARVLDNIHQGVERKKIFTVLAHVSPGYADDAGRNQAAVRDLLKEYFSSWRTVRVTRANPRLKVEGRQAVALESIGVIAEPFDVEASPMNWFGELRIWLELNDDGDWVITRVSHAG